MWNEVSGATSYEVTIENDTKVVTTAHKTLKKSDFINGIPYRVVIKAKNDVSNGPLSEPLYFLTHPAISGFIDFGSETEFGNMMDNFVIIGSTLKWDALIPVNNVRINDVTKAAVNNSIDLSTFPLSDGYYYIWFETAKYHFVSKLDYNFSKQAGKYFFDEGSGISVSKPKLTLDNDNLLISDAAPYDEFKVMLYVGTTSEVLVNSLTVTTLDLQAHKTKFPTNSVFTIGVKAIYQTIHMSEEARINLEYNGTHFYLEGEVLNPYEIKNLRVVNNTLYYDTVPGAARYVIWAGHKVFLIATTSFKLNEPTV